MRVHDDADSGKEVFGTPFDRWRPIGGGAEQDIFRRFNVRFSEEADFLTYWSEKRLSTGIFARDNHGTLVFRISSAHLAELTELEIGNPGNWSRSARWLHVYDSKGVSWLTQLRRADLDAFPETFDGTGQPLQRDGKVGQYGSSGHTVQDFATRHRVEAEISRIAG